MIRCINVHKGNNLKKDFNQKWMQIIKLKSLAN